MLSYSDLEQRLQETRKSSTAELVHSVGYTPPQFTAEERKEVLRFWSNCDLPVFTAKHQGMLSGSFVSRESRSPDDIRKVSLNIFNQSQEVKDALSTLEIPDVLNILGEDFYNRVFGDFGDDSIAQVVPVTACFEGISFLYSMQVSHHRLLAKISKSSRYKRLDKKREDSRFPYVVDPFIKTAGLEKQFREVIDSQFELYAGFATKNSKKKQELLAHLKKNVLPYEKFCAGVSVDLKHLDMAQATEVELEKAYQRTLHPLYLDMIRHLLPLATISATAALFNAQTARDMLLQGYTNPRGESLVYTELLRRELEKYLGPLIKDMNPEKERSQVWREFLFSQKDVGKCPDESIADSSPIKSYPDPEFSEYLVEKHRKLTRIVDPKTGFAVEVSTKDTLTDLVAAIIQEKDSRMTLGKAKNIAENISPEKQHALALDYAGTALRKNRRHKPGRAFERIGFDVSINGITIGELRDLRRHRMQTNFEPPYLSPENGFYLAPPLINTGFRDLLLQRYETASHLYQTLADKINPETAAIALPLATRTNMKIRMNLRQAHHFVELRTQPGAHGNYLKICQMTYAGMKEEFPLVHNTMTFVNKKEEIDYGRAIQEIRTMRKKEK